MNVDIGFLNSAVSENWRGFSFLVNTRTRSKKHCWDIYIPRKPGIRYILLKSCSSIVIAGRRCCHSLFLFAQAASSSPSPAVPKRRLWSLNEPTAVWDHNCSFTSRVRPNAPAPHPYSARQQSSWFPILLYQQQDAGITDYRYADRKKFGELRGDICAIRLVSTPSVTKKPPTITS
jgi:hypothetical protein